MWEALAIGSAALGLAGLIASLVRRRRRVVGRRAANATGPARRLSFTELDAVAATLGLELGDDGETVSGSLEGFPIVCRVVGERGAHISAVFELTASVDGAQHIPASLSIEAAPFRDGPRGLRHGERPADVEIGDESFDKNILVNGEESMVVALLDATARRKVQEAVNDQGCSVRGSVVHWRATIDDPTPDPHRVVSGLRRMVGLAQQLSLDPTATPARLRDNASRESLADVRRRNLEVLQRTFASSAEAAEANRAALRDLDIRVRLCAAVGLGAEGYDAAIAITRDDRAPASVRGEALRHLTNALPALRLREILRAALPTADQEARVALVRRMARQAETWAEEHAPELVREAEIDALFALACGLGGVPDDGTEVALLALLNAEVEVVRTAAVHALAIVGGRDAVGPLRELAERVAGESHLPSVIQSAVSQIQSRLSDAEPGRLSLAGTDGGELSAAPVASAGDLSLADRAGGGPQDDPEAR